MHASRFLAVSLALCQIASASRATGQELNLDALQKQAEQEGEAGQTVEAIRDYQLVLQARPVWKEGWWNLGALQYSANSFADATATLRHVVQFAPTLGSAWSLLGLSEFETRDFTNALTHLEKARSLGVNDDPEIERVSLYHLALLLIRSGEFDRASGLLLTGFGAGPTSEQIRFALGLATLRIPLLPDELDPAHEGLILAVGGAAGSDASHFPALIQAYPNTPYLHYAFARSLARANRNKEALNALREETALSPASPLAWIEISRLELTLGAKKDAIAAAEKAVALAPTSKSAHEALAAANPALEAAERKLAGQLAPVDPPERRIVLLYASAGTHSASTSISATNRELWQRGMAEYAEQNFAASAGHLRTWLIQHPDDGTSWAVLGLDEFSLNDADNALIHLERGATLGLSGSPESLQVARYTFGLLLLHAGEFDRASDILASALKTGPLDDKVEYALGLALLRRSPAFPITQSPPNGPLFAAAGRLSSLLRSSQYDAAFPQFQQLLRQYASTPFLHYAYGTALLAVSEFDQAAAQMQAERTISPKSELPCLRLASIALRQHDAAGAITWARQAIQLSTNSAEGHYLLGRASLEAGDDDAAVHELETAVRLSPASPEIHFNLARAYAHAKMPEKAAQQRALFSQLNEAAESQRSQKGSQMYAGPRDAGNLTTVPPAQQPRSP